MKPIIKLGYLAAACALLVATYAIIGPRVVRAAVETLVQVVNTTTSPVYNQDVNANSREPWTYTITQPCGAPNGTRCTFTFQPDLIPQGRRLIIEHVNAYMTGEIKAGAPTGILSTGVITIGLSGQVGLEVPYRNANAYATIDQSLHVQSEATTGGGGREGYPITVTITEAWSTDLQPFVTLSGYLKNCEIESCTDHSNTIQGHSEAPPRFTPMTEPTSRRNWTVAATWSRTTRRARVSTSLWL